MPRRAEADAIPGIGLLTATALAAWLGLTPKESSSGNRRRLGRISKRGDPYLRTLLIHGARSALNAVVRPGLGPDGGIAGFLRQKPARIL